MIVWYYYLQFLTNSINRGDKRMNQTGMKEVSYHIKGGIRNMTWLGKVSKTLISVSLMLMLMMNVMVIADLTFPSQAHAALGDGISNVDPNASRDTIKTEIDGWITTIRGIGIAIAVLGVVLGGIIFSVSLGNPQRRAMATGALMCAAGGIVVIAKAGSLAGFFLK
jgi:hypothetical protein